MICGFDLEVELCTNKKYADNVIKNIEKEFLGSYIIMNHVTDNNYKTKLSSREDKILKLLTLLQLLHQPFW